VASQATARPPRRRSSTSADVDEPTCRGCETFTATALACELHLRDVLVLDHCLLFWAQPLELADAVAGVFHLVDLAHLQPSDGVLELPQGSLRLLRSRGTAPRPWSGTERRTTPSRAWGGHAFAPAQTPVQGQPQQALPRDGALPRIGFKDTEALNTVGRVGETMSSLPHVARFLVL